MVRINANTPEDDYCMMCGRYKEDYDEMYMGICGHCWENDVADIIRIPRKQRFDDEGDC